MRRMNRKLLAIVAALTASAIAAAALVLASGQSARASGNGEVWATSQVADKLFIVKGHYGEAGIETVDLPAGTGPHITTFSPDGRYAYVSGMGNGKLEILRAQDRQIVATLNLGPILTHQAKASPDGSILLVAQIATSSLIKVAVDEPAESWTVVDSVSFVPLGKRPICTILRDDGERAYVSLRPSGLAIVDVPTMTIVGTRATDGFIACGMVKSHDGRTVTIASDGSGGHLYRLDTETETLADIGTVGAPSWHSFSLSEDGKLGLGSSPMSDEVVLLDLSGPTLGTSNTLALDPTPGMGNDQPDRFAIRGNTVYVSLRMSGKLAIVDLNQRRVRYLELSPAVSTIDMVTCAGCALHGNDLRE